MKRSPIRSKAAREWQKPPRRLPEVPAVPPVVRAVMSAASNEVAAAPKHKVHRDQRIRDSACDEACLLRMPGCLGSLAGAVIWSHYRGSAGGKGMGLKSHDVAGAYACTHCDAIYDGQVPPPEGWARWMVEIAWHEGHIRSLGRLHEKGLL